MKAKLTKQQFNTLADLVKEMAYSWPQADIEDRLLKCMMQRLHIELEQRRLLVQPYYRISWHPERALAFAAVVSRLSLEPTSHAGNVALQLHNQIVQKYQS